MGFEPTENDLSGGLLAPYPTTRKNLLASGLRQWDSNPITSFSGAALGPCLTSQRVHLGHKSERIIRRLFLNKNAASNDWSTAPVFWLVSILEPPRRGIDCPGRCILLNRSRNGMRRNHATHRQTDRPGQSKPATTSCAFCFNYRIFKTSQNIRNRECHPALDLPIKISKTAHQKLAITKAILHVFCRVDLRARVFGIVLARQTF